MKKILFIILGLAFLVTTKADAQVTAQSARITYPIDRMVFQRAGTGGTNAKGTANIQIAGQYTNGWESIGDWVYGITLLDPNGGNPAGAANNITGGWLPLPTISNTSGLPFQRFFLENTTLANGANLANLSAGWYRFELSFHQTYTLGGQTYHVYSGGSSIKFGVGDVYFIAGQSNARGFENLYDDEIIDYYNGTAVNTLPDAVSVINAYSSIDLGGRYSSAVENQDGSGGLPLSYKFSKMQFKLVTPFIETNGSILNYPIYPIGPTSWCYSILGNNLINGAGAPNVPVLFFNTASAGQPVHSWINNNNGTYTRFRNTLRNFGSILGTRGVLWHQGENDNANGTSTANYQADLNTVITNSRNFLPAVPWFVSKVSYNPLYGLAAVAPNVIAAQTNIINPSNGIFAGISSDDRVFDGGQPFNLTRRGPTQKIHFHAEEHKTMGDRWFAAQPWQGASVQGKTAPKKPLPLP